MNVEAISKCRSCGLEKLVPILSLGEQYVTNFVESSHDQTLKVPLDLILCDPNQGGCGLLQLRHTTPGEILYGKHYWYRSGVNQTMRDELADVTGKIESLIDLRDGDLVLDIGCNDGTLLRSYKTNGLKLTGMDPATNMMPFAREGTTKIINDFFNYESFSREFGNEKAKVITAISMFYDLDDPNKFIDDAKRVLAPDGVFVIQQNYLVGMLEQVAFDNICHEHLEYYSLFSLENLLKRHNMEVFDVEMRDINGGSFRTYIRHAGAKLPSSPLGEKRLRDLRAKEDGLELDQKEVYEKFASKVSSIGERLHSFVKQEVDAGKTIYVYGASTRGNTTLQFAGLDHTLIRGAAERNPDKYGKKTVGTLIPIVSEEEARSAKPDYFLILPWHFLEEFIKREAEYLKNGGKFIVPLPDFRIIGNE